MRRRTISFAAVAVVLVLAGGAVLAGKQSTTSVAELTGAAFTAAYADHPGATLLDVRTPEEFAQGHIPGATNLNYNDGSFAAQLSSLDRNATYFVYCRSGHRSGLATTLMREAGFTSVYDLKGGIVGSPGLVQ